MIEVGLEPLGEEIFIPRPEVENQFQIEGSARQKPLGLLAVPELQEGSLEFYYADSTVQKLSQL